MKSTKIPYNEFSLLLLLLVGIVFFGQILTTVNGQTTECHGRDGFPCTPLLDDGTPGDRDEVYVCINKVCVSNPCDGASLESPSCSLECFGKPYGTPCIKKFGSPKSDGIPVPRICNGRYSCIEDPCYLEECHLDPGKVCVMGKCIPKCTLSRYACRAGSFNDGCASEWCNEETGLCEMEQGCNHHHDEGHVCKTVSEPCDCSWSFFGWRCSTCEVEYHCETEGCTCSRPSNDQQ